MKHIFLTILLIGSVSNADNKSCKVSEESTIIEKQEDVNTKVPRDLEGAEIIIKRKDGTTETIKSEEFKVVKRKQQFKVKERSIIQRVECAPTIIVKEKKEKKNLLAVGARRDHTGLHKSVNGNIGTVSSERAMVLDLSYTRRQILDSPFALGVGLDTNGVLRGLVGIEF